MSCSQPYHVASQALAATTGVPAGLACSGQGEAWQQTPEQYLAAFKAAEQRTQAAYDALYREYVSEPTGVATGRSGEADVRFSVELGQLQSDPQFDGLQRRRQQAMSATSTARTAYFKSVKRALREGQPVSEAVIIAARNAMFTSDQPAFDAAVKLWRAKRAKH